MSVAISAHWGASPEVIIANVKAWLQAVLHGIVYLCAEFSRRMEGYAKANRPWKDQTTQARTGLTGRVRVLESGHAQAIVAHTVEYGIWLEVRRAFHGRYAILLKTQQAHQDEFWNAFVKLVFDFG